MKVTINLPIKYTPRSRSVVVELPVLPRHGDYIDHDDSGISGTVDRVMFWWPEGGKEGPEIEVRLASQVEKPEAPGMLVAT